MALVDIKCDLDVGSKLLVPLTLDIFVLQVVSGYISDALCYRAIACNIKCYSGI